MRRGPQRDRPRKRQIRDRSLSGLPVVGASPEEGDEGSRPGDSTVRVADRRATPGAGISVLPEPELEFRFGQRLVDPHAGLALFGPVDADAPGGRPSQITYGVVGTPTGIALFTDFARGIARPIVSQPYGDPAADQKGHLLWPPFPGFEEVFVAKWPLAPAYTRALDAERLTKAARHNDPYHRAYEAAGMYRDAVRDARERDESFGLIICVVPDEVWLNCRPRSRVTDGEGVRTSRQDRKQRREQADLFDAYRHEEYEMSVDFRRQLKARVMEFNIPIQIIRESTLVFREPVPDDDRTLTALSDRAWNLSTAFYYKAGGKPWRLGTAREGVCYVGLAFRRSEIEEDDRTACCAAQMFLDTGDGVVFRGKFGPWYSEQSEQFHLSTDAAEELLRGVIDEYRKLDGRPLKEVFLHSRSEISRSEFAGYQKACPSGVKLVGVRVRRDTDGMRLYRPGKWPVLRGTLWVINPRSAYLWATGFKPTVLSYDGWEVPVPLRIDIQHGDGDIKQIAADILGLTKLNYNACKLGDAAPVTVGFSDQVGEILIGNPNIAVRNPSFKFYI